MIDRALFRKNPEKIIQALKSKDPSYPIERLIALDEQVRALNAHVEQLRYQKNDLAQQGKRGVSEELKQRSREVSQLLKQKIQELEVVEREFMSLYLYCPNIPFHDVPVGGKEANRVIKVHGQKPTFDFTVKNHLELGNALGWLDFEAAAVMTGSNFALYKGDAVKLLYSLTLFMIKNNVRSGFQPILPPYMVNRESLQAAGQFPRFEDQVYYVKDDDLYLTPTSEVNLTNLYRDQIVSAQDLPLKMTSWTSCFRREAGTYGATERGLIRIHQFEKIELYTLCQPHDSDAELDRMVTCAENILQQLGLHYRISLLATQDMSFQAAKTFDIEVWLPGQGAYYEVSSCSNCTDFQARRSAIRFRPEIDKKTEYVHTLNGSSLAVPRLMVALMETYQQKDGTIKIPEVLAMEGLW